jgi:hypothetical protein
LDYIKDDVSKDLRIQWNQIKLEKIKICRDKGFQPVKFADWWKIPIGEGRGGRE